MRKFNPCFFVLIFFLTFSSCRKDEKKAPQNSKGYDIILVMGQSNTHFGFGIDSVTDVTHPLIQQLGRFNENNYKIIPATEPLDHHTKKQNRIGFALTFAKLYTEVYLEDEREILIIPCGKSGTGFHNNKWNKGDVYYEDAVARTEFVLKNFPNSKLAAILWHQGEDDVNNTNYQTQHDKFIQQLREDLSAENIPFIVGGMVPFWVEQLPQRISTQAIIKDTPNRILTTGYADPTSPILIEADTVESNAIHYTAAGLRELGTRYFLEFVKLE